MTAVIVSLWLDTERTGCGWRDYVAMPGRKWVRLIMLASGETVRLSMADYQKAFAKRQKVRAQSSRNAARRLRRNARTFGNQDSSAVKAALAAMRVPPDMTKPPTAKDWSDLEAAADAAHADLQAAIAIQVRKSNAKKSARSRPGKAG